MADGIGRPVKFQDIASQDKAMESVGTAVEDNEDAGDESHWKAIQASLRLGSPQQRARIASVTPNIQKLRRSSTSHQTPPSIGPSTPRPRRRTSRSSGITESDSGTGIRPEPDRNASIMSNSEQIAAEIAEEEAKENARIKEAEQKENEEEIKQERRTSKLRPASGSWMLHGVGPSRGMNMNNGEMSLGLP